MEQKRQIFKTLLIEYNYVERKTKKFRLNFFYWFYDSENGLNECFKVYLNISIKLNNCVIKIIHCNHISTNKETEEKQQNSKTKIIQKCVYVNRHM